MNESGVHLHVENSADVNEVFEISKSRVQDALDRHPEVADRIRITIGYGGDILDRELATADAVFCWDFDRRDLRRRAPNLRWVHAHGAGVGHMMPLDWLPPGAVLTNSRGVHGQRATEYAFMAILMLSNRIPEMVANQQRARWQEVFSTGIEGKTLLIIGVGHIGKDVAAWAKRAGMQVLGIRRSGGPRRHVDEMYKPVHLHGLLPRADFILVSAPHTAASHHMLAARELAMLKPGAGLVNYSRANLVDYDALRAKLEAGEMSAVLDVFDPEPLPASSLLWKTPNLIITPHCSSDDRDQYTPRTLDLVLRNMQRFIDGRALVNRVSRKHQY
ncbi:MAG: D-2-hydroxyacid dehydrogenase [Gammaproteobacteria bacterium]|nr:D-2-hydroxyacid dehydrogenase [Gammaproteobacteria bacterium]MDX2459518.1 D-2-hydroxyacid dehydrogenase [Gammaproteobacteria bacterium]